jgi:dihydrofolate reductase
MKMSAASAEAFDGFIGRIGAVISGRRTYDIAQAWHGEGEVPGVPLFVVTHHVPDQVPPTTVPYTFVTDGIASAVRHALAAASGKDVRLMGASIVQQCLQAALLDELTSRSSLAAASACSTTWTPARSTWIWSGSSMPPA